MTLIESGVFGIIEAGYFLTNLGLNFCLKFTWLFRFGKIDICFKGRLFKAKKLDSGRPFTCGKLLILASVEEACSVVLEESDFECRQ